MKGSIFQFLADLRLTSIETRSIFNKRTRDVDQLTVWRDDVSKVIYIDEFYTGDDAYVEGTYREDERLTLQTGALDYEKVTDAERRLQSNLPLIAGKKIIDFGCGSGDFLRLAKSYCAQVCGVELQRDYVDNLNADNIVCVSTLNDINYQSFDICVSFHVIEHLPDPVETLTVLKKKIAKGGSIVIEVPHANDFLLSTLMNEEFKQFTLWSQHLILHTRESLRRMLEYIGFEDIQIVGVQRYPLSNHLGWLANGKPGGHKSLLSAIESPEMRKAYSDSLARIDATDTLVAIAEVR